MTARNVLSPRLEAAIRRYCARHPALSRDYVCSLVRRRDLVLMRNRPDLVPSMAVPLYTIREGKQS